MGFFKRVVEICLYLLFFNVNIYIVLLLNILYLFLSEFTFREFYIIFLLKVNSSANKSIVFLQGVQNAMQHFVSAL